MSIKKTVEFKSISPYFEAERDNLKPHTERKIEAGDLRITALREGNVTHIKIINPHTLESFTRRVKHYCEWAGISIISWFEEAV